MVRSIQVDAAQAHVLFAWIVQHDPPDHPGKYTARLATTHPTIYVVQADTLVELQVMLPEGLEHSTRQDGDPPEIVEVWFIK